MSDETRDEGILTDLVEQSTGLRLVQRVVTIPSANVATLLTSQEPRRLAFLVTPLSLSNNYMVAPTNAITGVFTASPSALDNKLIHASAYPLLVSQAWYIYCQSAGTILVSEVIRLR